MAVAYGCGERKERVDLLLALFTFLVRASIFVWTESADLDNFR